MTLAVGTSLQHGRYTLTAILQQHDAGVSYEAQDQHLEQSVLIQVPACPLEDKDASEEWSQAVVRAAREHRKKATAEVRVLDCFVEAGVPYIVIEQVPEMALPSLHLWTKTLPLSIFESPSDEAIAASSESLSPSLNAAPEPRLDWASTAASPRHPTGATRPIPSRHAASPSARSSTPTSHSAHVFVSDYRRKSRTWLPLAMAVTATVGGSAGALFGWQMRQGKTLSEVVPVVGSRLNTDQSFPPLEGWPIGRDRSLSPSPASEIDTLSPGDRVRQSEDYADDPGTDESIQVEPYSINYEYGQSEPQLFQDPYVPSDFQPSTPPPTAQIDPPSERPDLSTPGPAPIGSPSRSPAPQPVEEPFAPSQDAAPVDKLDSMPPVSPNPSDAGDRPSTSAPAPTVDVPPPPLSTIPQEAIVPQ